MKSFDFPFLCPIYYCYAFGTAMGTEGGRGCFIRAEATVPLDQTDNSCSLPLTFNLQKFETYEIKYYFIPLLIPLHTSNLKKVSTPDVEYLLFLLFLKILLFYFHLRFLILLRTHFIIKYEMN